MEEYRFMERFVPMLCSGGRLPRVAARRRRDSRLRIPDVVFDGIMRVVLLPLPELQLQPSHVPGNSACGLPWA